MKFSIFPVGGKMLKMRKIAARYSFQHACHATSNRAENWRRVAPKYAHICRKKSRICKMLIFTIF
ncbi:hypothetical protein [Pseudoflavonifractor phocaeensis]|uniref:hypothetical protein n=1 Tax=Pseudoflavonifractor phocaeensis TaxID=1870988 RepID=UPI00195BE2D7|nr:hypothetical protein [Pseudoflavonifractor phocaeensis]MBM6887030.1 hypothetical protein [Pseudoflavonifractor phocaeensis]